MMCLLFDFFRCKDTSIYIHWEIVTKYLFPQKCCPIEDKLFIRNAVLSSQMAVFEDKFNPAPSRTRGCHCRVLFVRCSRVKYRVKYFWVSRLFPDNLSPKWTICRFSYVKKSTILPFPSVWCFGMPFALSSVESVKGQAIKTALNRAEDLP